MTSDAVTVKNSLQVFATIIGIGVVEIVVLILSTALIYESLGGVLATLWFILILIVEVMASLAGFSHYYNQVM